MGGPATGTALRVEVADCLEDLDGYAAAWDALAARVPQGLPMLSHTWARALFAQRLDPAERYYGFFAFAGETLVGVLPVVATPTRVLGMARARLYVPCAYNTDHGDVLLAPECAVEALGALLSTARETVPGLLRIDLGCVREGSPTIAAIQHGVRGWLATRGAANHGSAVPIEGSFEDWKAATSKSLRRDLRQGRSRLQRKHTDPVFECLEGADATPDHLDALAAIEATGWKGREGGAIAADPDRERRYVALAEGYSARGWLEWHFLNVGHRPVAAHMCVRVGQSLMLLRQVYDERFRRNSVGTLLPWEAVKREYADARSVELNLVNDYEWCRRWRMRLSAYYRYQLTPKRPLALTLGAGPAIARSTARRIPGLRRFVRWIKRDR